MAWVTKFTGLPINSIIPVAGDAYGAGVFTIGGGTPSFGRGWFLGLQPGSANESPIAYETLSSMSASISNVLRITARYASRVPTAGFTLGGGVALFGPGTDDAMGVGFYETAPVASPGDGLLEAVTHENDVRASIGGPVPVIANGVPHRYRIYWNGTGTAFIIPDAGFGSWSVPANTVSYWYSLDDGATWVRNGDRAIAGGVAPTRAGIFESSQPGENNGDTVTFSNLEVAEETTADIVDPVVDNFTPAANSTLVDPDQELCVDITDVGDGLDVSSVVLSINGTIAWQTDAATVGYTGRKEAIAGGYRYFIRADVGMPEGQIDFRVQADDLAGAPNSADVTNIFFVGSREPIEVDLTQRVLQTWDRYEFDGSKDLVAFAPFGTAVETLGKLQLTLGAAESGDLFNNSNFSVPYASFRFGNQPFDRIRIEAALTDFTGSNTQRIAGMALTDGRKGSNLSYYQLLYRDDIDQVHVERGIRGAGHVNVASSGGWGAFNGQHRQRIDIDRRDNTIKFYYSNNNGSSYGLIYQVTPPSFEPDQVILYIRQFSSNPSVDAQWDWIEIQVGDLIQARNSPAPGTVASPEDAVEYPEAVGPDKYNQEFGAGVRWPGPPLQQPDAETAGPFDTTAPLDEVEYSGPALITPTAPGILTEPLVQRHKGFLDDAITFSLGVDADYADFKQDGDGNDLLGGQAIRQVVGIDTSVGGFGDPTNNNHYGAARDGQFYDDGVVCGPGDFGTLAGGFRRTAWRRSLDEPRAVWNDMGVQPSMVANDTLRLDTNGVASGWSEFGPQVVSNGCWVLTGDFDIEIEYANWNIAAGANLFLGFTVMHQTPFNGAGYLAFRVARFLNSGSDQYYKDALNPGASGAASVATADTAGKMRITRTGTTLRAFYDNAGWVQIGTDDTTATVNTGDVFVRIYLSAQSSTNGSVDIKSFTINTGATSNKAGWAREATGAHRGTQSDMPTNMGTVITVDSVDLVDLTNNKLWMRFVRGTNNLVFTSTGTIPRRVKWDDGQLLLAHGETDAGGGTGGGMMIDFTLDTARMYRFSASIPGAFYGTTNEHVQGGISRRNSAVAWGGTDAAWVIPSYKCRDVSLYRDSGFEFHAFATVDGVGVGKWERWFTQNSPTVLTSFSTEVTTMLAVLLDPSNGELFYMDATNIYSIDKTTWEGVMLTTQVFSAAVTKALSGTRNTDLQHHFVKHGNNIYVPSNEGIHMVVWPGGSFTLRFGGPTSGATFPILPDDGPVHSIAYAVDGATPVLVCGLSGDTPLLIINLNTNTVHAIAPSTLGKTPTVVAAL
jgi:hypothetical protein